MRALRNKLASAVSASSRTAKTARLDALVPDGASVLAVGVSDPEYSESHNVIENALAQRTWLVGVFYPPLQSVEERCPFPLIRGDGCALPFADNSFDFVISNAVVEHVGDASQQQVFIAESLRVARRGVFHTTPNRWHPVETHTKTVLLHWLPRRLHLRALSRNGRYAWQETDRLIGSRELRALMGAGATVEGWPKWWPLTFSATAKVDVRDENDVHV